MEAYLTKGMFFNSIKWKWQRTNKVKLKIVADTNAPLTQYQFFDPKTDDLIKL